MEGKEVETYGPKCAKVLWSIDQLVNNRIVLDPSNEREYDTSNENNKDIRPILASDEDKFKITKLKG